MTLPPPAAADPDAGARTVGASSTVEVTSGAAAPSGSIAAGLRARTAPPTQEVIPIPGGASTADLESPALFRVVASTRPRVAMTALTPRSPGH